MVGKMWKLVPVLYGLMGFLLSSNFASARCIVKCITVHKNGSVTATGSSSLTITPLGVLPSTLGKPVNQVIGTGAKAAAAPSIAIVNIIAGKETLGQAGANVASAQGASLQAVGETVSEYNAQIQNEKIVAASKIGGNVGKTIMTLATGPDRLSVEFAATTAIEAGGLLQGMPADRSTACRRAQISGQGILTAITAYTGGHQAGFSESVSFGCPGQCEICHWLYLHICARSDEPLPEDF
jgi:hypothetical protein